MDPDSDPNWAKILDPDPISMYLDPQHWLKAYRYFIGAGAGASEEKKPEPVQNGLAP